MNEQISIEEAAARGIERLRQPQWVTPEDHLKLDIINGKPGPWTHRYAPFNLECNGKDPVDVICMNMNYKSADWLPYTGPISDSDEYRAAQARYAGCLSANVRVSDPASTASDKPDSAPLGGSPSREYCDMCAEVTDHPLPACPGINPEPDKKLIYISEGKTEHSRQDVLETPDAAEALEHLLKCWLVYHFREVSIKREYRVMENVKVSHSRE